MNYELAKELKDAGFPLRHCEYAHVDDKSRIGPCAYCDQPAFVDSEEGGHESFSIVPTLAELIAACGYDKFNLYRYEGEWTAEMLDEEIIQNFYQCNGETAEEAVARLWLAIRNKK